MRTLVLVTLVLSVSSTAAAQHASAGESPPPTAFQASSSCWPVSTREQVVVTTVAGTTRKGTLLCMGPEEVVLAGSPALPLNTVQKIAKPRDGILDGVIKGASVGLIIFALCAGECDAEYLLRGTLAYAAIGGTIDALQGNDKTIYRKDLRSASVAWRLRF